MRGTVLQIAGALTLLSVIPHAFLAWPSFRRDLLTTGVDPNVVGALAAGWMFGSTAMVVFGLLGLVSGARLRRGDRSGVTVMRLVALAYVLFGATAFVARGMNPHFMYFVAIGVLIAAPLTGLRAGQTPDPAAGTSGGGSLGGGTPAAGPGGGR